VVAWIVFIIWTVYSDVVVFQNDTFGDNLDRRMKDKFNKLVAMKVAKEKKKLRLIISPKSLRFFEEAREYVGRASEASEP